MNLGHVLDFLLGIGKEYPKPVNFSVTVLVPAYNEEASIAKTIASLKNQTYPVERILVIDDCSTDATRQIALQLGVDVVTTPEQTGTKAQAQNYALPSVTTDAVVTVDGDTCLAPDAIEKILPPLQDGTVASVCGFVLPQKVRTIWERARYIQYLYSISIVKTTQSNWGGTLVSSGCFSAYLIRTLRQFGGFPYRTVVEDMDLTWIQAAQGYKVALVPEARCYPKDPHNYATYRDQLDRWLRGFLQLIALHWRNWRKNPVLACFVVWGLVEGLLAPIIVAISVPLLVSHGLTFITVVTAVLGAVVVGVATVLQAAKENRAMLALQSLPCFFLVAPVNMYLFWRSLVLEWVLGRKLTVWNKGH